jgi:transposase InsO family protein
MRTPAETETVIVSLRHLKRTEPQIALVLGLPRSTVGLVLKRGGLGKLSALEVREPVRRYEHEAAGDMLHLDIKKLGRFVRPGHRVTGNRRDTVDGAGWEYVHVCIDDYYRVAYVEVLAIEKADTTTGFLERATAWFVSRQITVRRILTDNGPAYCSRMFLGRCRERGAKACKTRPYTPRTNGKAERFIQTLLREWASARTYAKSAERPECLRHWLR